MVQIANFNVLSIAAFSNPPGGGNDPFVASSIDASVRYKISIDDDDTTIDGDTVTNETPNDTNQIATVTDSTGAVVGVDASYVEWTATYTGTNGQVIQVWRIELDDPIPGIGKNFFAMSEQPEVGITFTTSNKDQGADGLDPDDIPSGIPCFTLDTIISTPVGPKTVQSLAVGDLVITKNNGLQAVRWIGVKKVTGARLYSNPDLHPILIKQNAIDINQPYHDLIVSPQHRMVIRHPLGSLLYDNISCLVSAKSLLGRPGIEQLKTKSVTYIHLMFDTHEIIYANGCETESFHPGLYILNSMEKYVQNEILKIFPKLKEGDIQKNYGPTVLPVLNGDEARAYIDKITNTSSV